jgi:D-alanine-D-alanine ligase
MRKLKVTILYDEMEDREKAEADAQGKKFPLAYRQVEQALSGRGHSVDVLAVPSDVRNFMRKIDKLDCDILFNLCETFGGVSQHEQNVAALLELLNKPFTGAGSIGLALSQDKELSKKILAFHGIQSPRYAVIDSGKVEWSDDIGFPALVKPVSEDGSIGIDSKAVVHNIKELMERISYIHTEHHSPALIEEYIEGREIYVGVLGNEALPIFEMDFSRVPEGVPKIASEEAKWDDESEVAKGTFEFFPTDISEAAYKKIQEAAAMAFGLLKLRDYGRIDMRLRKSLEKDEDWEFYIIEVNGNPHLEMESELPRAAMKQGLEYPDLIEKIVQLALERNGSKVLFESDEKAA